MPRRALALIAALSCAAAVWSGPELDLEQLAFDELLELEIETASKFPEKVSQTPSTIIVVTAEQIAELGYTDVVQLLQELPGFDVLVKNGAGYAHTYVRGNQTEIADRMLLFIDGVNYQSLGFQTMDISRLIPISAIKRIEILYGPSSAIYGADAFSGILNVITWSPTEPTAGDNELRAHLGGGSFGTGFVDASYIGNLGRLGLFLCARAFHSDEPDYSDRPGFFSDRIIRESWRPLADRYDRYEDPSDEYSVIARLGYNDLELGFIRSDYAEGVGPEYPADKVLPAPQWRGFRNLAYAKYSRAISDRIDLKWLLAFKNGDTPPDSAFSERYDSDGDGDPDVSIGYWQFYNEQLSFSQDFVYRAASNTVVNGGISLASSDFQKGYQINWGPWVDASGDSYPEFPATPSDQVGPDHRYRMRSAGGYLQLRQTVLDGRLILVPGLRYDYNSIYEDRVQPRVGAVYEIADGYLLKASYATGFQYPSPRNLYGSWEGTTVSENLEPEKIRAFEVSFLFAVGDSLVNEVNAFYDEIDNTNLQGRNLPSREITGVEYKLSYDRRFSSRSPSRLRIFFNYSWTDPRYVEPVASPASGRSSDRIGNIAEHKLNLGIGVTLGGRYDLMLRNSYVGERVTLVTNPIEEVDSYLVSNLHLRVRRLLGHDGLELSLAANNLFDEVYSHPGVVDAGAGEEVTAPSLSWYSSRLPQPERNYMVTLKTVF